MAALDNLIFKNRLREALDLRAMTSAELSKRCGINKSAICRYLQGTIGPRPQAAEALAVALGVSPAWLLGFDGDMKPVDIPEIQPREYNPIDYSKLNQANKIRIKAYYQALLDTQEGSENG